MLLWKSADVWGSRQTGRWTSKQPLCGEEEKGWKESQAYLLLKDESHGESDSLEQQQHTEDTQELQTGGKGGWKDPCQTSGDVSEKGSWFTQLKQENSVITSVQEALRRLAKTSDARLINADCCHGGSTVPFSVLSPTLKGRGNLSEG